MNRIFIAGSKGMLASDLISILTGKGDIVGGNRPEFDISDFDRVMATFKMIKPNIVVNCAAYTDVDGAESKQALALAVNADGVNNLAIACREVGAKLVHISTDYVFDGKSNIPYKEDDKPNPLNVYGQSKLEGEEVVREIMDNYIIIRTSWLYGRYGGNFVKSIQDMALKKETLSIVYDQVGTPTYTKDLARAIINLMESVPSGIYNFSNEGVCSWYDFAYEILSISEKQGHIHKLKKLLPIPSEEYPTAAKRPAYSILNKSKYKETTSKVIPHWKDALQRFLSES